MTKIRLFVFELVHEKFPVAIRVAGQVAWFVMNVCLPVMEITKVDFSSAGGR